MAATPGSPSTPLKEQFSTIQVQPFDLNLIVEPDVLGTQMLVDLGDEEFVELRFPTSGSGALTDPPAVSGDLAWALGSDGWGQSFEADGGAAISLGAVAFVGRFRGAVPIPPPGEALGGPHLDALAVKTEEWFRRWLDWCGTLTSQPVSLHNPGTATPSPRSSAVPRWIQTDDGSRFTQNVMQTISLHGIAGFGLGPSISSERCAGSPILARAVEEANARHDPPLDLQLRANSHLAAGRVSGSRLAVVEIGTATEQWLTNALELPSDHGKTLGGLVTTASRAGLTMPGDTQAGLVDVRNDAIHRGKSPNRATESRAQEIAEEIWRLSDAVTHDLVALQRRVFRPLRQDLVL